MYVWAPVIAGVLLSLAGAVLLYAEFESELPHSLHNETEWLALASYVSARTHASSLPTRLGVLLALHALHIYACLPLLHLTKVLYGMWLGLVWGWLCCVAWELLLFALYLAVMPRHGSHVLLLCTQRSRTAGKIFLDNVMMAMSSFPLHVSAYTYIYIYMTIVLIHIYMQYLDIGICMYKCVCIYNIFIYIYIHKYIYVYIYMYICLFVYTYIYIYIYIYIYLYI